LNIASTPPLTVQPTTVLAPAPNAPLAEMSPSWPCSQPAQRKAGGQVRQNVIHRDPSTSPEDRKRFKV
jgi:hypothetical protein